MRYKFNKNKGFTMVELLATITIMGILMVLSVGAIQGLLARARSEYYKSQRQDMEMAARTYFQNNSKKMPRVNGQTTRVDLKTLQDQKLISKVVDYSKKDCIYERTGGVNDRNYSFVEVTKINDEYVYYSNLFCPGDKRIDDSVHNRSSINVVFSGDISNAKAAISISDPKNIIAYKYQIFKGSGSNKIMVYDSSYISNETTSVSKNVSLTKWVPGTITIEVSAINGLNDMEFKSFSTASVEYNDLFKDKSAPSCVVLSGAATAWTKGPVTVTVGCSDDGSGCVKDKVTKKFTADTYKSNIDVKDLDNNTGSCTDVPIMIDATPTELTVNVYKKATGNSKMSNTVMNTITTDKTTPNKNLTISNGAVNGWLNKTNYPNGIVVEINYTEPTSGVKELKWELNNKGLNSTDGNAKTFTTTVNESLTNKKSGTLTYYIADNGWRYGKITAVDEAGNTSSITITAPIDNVSPTCTPDNITTWSTADRTVHAQCGDSGSGCEQTTYSKLYNVTKTDKHTFTVKDKAGNTATCQSNVMVDKDPPTCTKTGEPTTWGKDNRTITIKCNDVGSGCVSSPGTKTFTAEQKTESYTLTDVAGNTSTCTTNVYIDRTPPSCEKINEPSGWTNQNRTITINCKDSVSGCKSSPGAVTFTSNQKTKTYDFEDNAGNKSSCTTNVLIDKNGPSFNVNIYKVDNNNHSVVYGVANNNEWSQNHIRRNMSATDVGDSGIREYQYNTGSGWTHESNFGDWYFTGGINDAWFRAVDNAGNTSNEVHLILKVDATPPNIPNPNCYKSTCADGGSSYQNHFRADITDWESGVASASVSYCYVSVGCKSMRTCASGFGNVWLTDGSGNNGNTYVTIGHLSTACAKGRTIRIRYNARDNAGNQTGTIEKTCSY